VEHEAHEHGSGGATAELQAIVCPYCGAEQAPAERCVSCGGMFEPLSRQASQNQMGPWYIRDERNPFRPGCSYATLRRLAARGAIRRDTVIRGPTTRQFWARAIHVPGVAHLLGECHNCHATAQPDDYMCASCGVVFSTPEDRQFLGLGPVRLLPGQAPPEIVARSSLTERREAPHAPAESKPPTPSAERPLALPQKAAATDETRDLAPGETPGALAKTRRLQRRLGQLRLIVGALVALNLLLLLLLAVAASPRLQFGGAGAGDGAAAETPAAGDESAPE